MERRRETALRRVLRSDDESFVKISRRLELDVDSAGPVQEALKTGREVVVSYSISRAHDDASFALFAPRRLPYIPVPCLPCSPCVCRSLPCTTPPTHDPSPRAPPGAQETA